MESLQDILSEIGWDSGLGIPVANAECKLLQEKLTKKQQQCSLLKTEIHIYDNKITNLKTDFQNVKEELARNASLIGARAKEIESEEHMHCIAEGEQGHLRQKIKDCQLSERQTDQRRTALQADAGKLNQSVNRLKQEMSFDRAALDAWLRQMATRDDDILALERYSRQDECKLKQLNLQLETLNVEDRAASNELTEASTELSSVMTQVDKLGEDYRALHLERQALLDKWEDVLRQIQQREEVMRQNAVKLNEFQENRLKMNQVLERNQRFLEQEQLNNKDLEVNFVRSEKQLERAREQSRRTADELDQFKLELEAMKTNSSKASVLLRQNRDALHQLKNKISNKWLLHTGMESQAGKAEQALEEVREMVLTTEEKNEKLAAMLEEEAVRQKKLNLEVNELKKVLFDNDGILRDNKSKEILATSEIQACITVRKNLQKRLNRLNHDVTVQKDRIYSKEALAENLQRRIEKMEGANRNDVEYQRLKLRIEQLSQDLQGRRSNKSFLDNQIKQIERSRIEIQQVMQSLRRQGGTMEERALEYRLHSECSSRDLRRAVEERRAAIVDSTLLQLNLKQLTTALRQRCNRLASLDQHRQQMQDALDRRRVDVNQQQDLHRLHLKTINDEISKLNRDIFSRQSKVDNMRKRYEVLLTGMGTCDDDQSLEEAHFYWVIRAVQEKEQVQREGDELDAKIKKTEAELEALKNTCCLIKKCNGEFEQAINPNTETTEMEQKREELLERLQVEKNHLAELHQEVSKHEEEVVALEQLLERLDQEKLDIHQQEGELDRGIETQRKELGQQQEKLERAVRLYERIIKQSRNKCISQEERASKEKDIELKKKRKELKFVIEAVGDLCEVDASLVDVLRALQDEADVGSSVSSLSMSAASSEISLSMSSTSACVWSRRSAEESSRVTSAPLRSPLASVGSRGRPRSGTGSPTRKRDAGRSSQSSKKLGVVNISFSSTSHSDH